MSWQETRSPCGVCGKEAHYEGDNCPTCHEYFCGACTDSGVFELSDTGEDETDGAQELSDTGEDEADGAQERRALRRVCVRCTRRPEKRSVHEWEVLEYALEKLAQHGLGTAHAIRRGCLLQMMARCEARCRRCGVANAVSDAAPGWQRCSKCESHLCEACAPRGSTRNVSGCPACTEPEKRADAAAGGKRAKHDL